MSNLAELYARIEKAAKAEGERNRQNRGELVKFIDHMTKLNISACGIDVGIDLDKGWRLHYGPFSTGAGGTAWILYVELGNRQMPYHHKPELIPLMVAKLPKLAEKIAIMLEKKAAGEVL